MNGATSVQQAVERVRRLLEAEEKSKLFGTVTVFFQDGNIERVEVKKLVRVGDLK